MRKTRNGFKSKKIEQKISLKRFLRKRRKLRKRRLRYRRQHEKNTIFMPKLINLENKSVREETLQAVERIRSMASTTSGTLVLDFTQTTRCYASGMILLLASIDFALDQTGRPCIRARNVKADLVRQVIKQIGLAEKLGLNQSIVINRQNVNYWRHVRGSNVDTERASDHFDHFCSDAEISEEDRSALYNAFSEAVDNAHSHAYDDALTGASTRVFPRDKRWWMFSGVDKDHLVILVCDLGLGIPVTVQRKGIQEAVSHAGANAMDSIRVALETMGVNLNVAEVADEGRLIKATIHAARSRTGQGHRGKGMYRLKRAIEKLGHGDLIIYSNKGAYHYRHKDGNEPKEMVMDHRSSINGTVVLWKVPVHLSTT